MPSTSIDYRAELNEEQYAAVTAEPGPALVLAGAGSGKTRTLTHRVAYLLNEKNVHPESLLLLTFTNKAAKEMVERVQDLTGSALRPRWSGTFHSIGGRLLRQYGSQIGLGPNYTILDQGDAESLLTSLIKEDDKTFIKNKDNPKPKVILNMISYARNTCMPLEDIIKVRFPWNEYLAGKIRNFARIYTQSKLDQQVADYDDLLAFWLKLLKEHSQVREACTSRFPYILVDEYQDTNTIQAQIIDLIGSHHNIMAVGDDAQCIYTWRGADFENIRSFPERHPGTRIYKILTNYRSTPKILNFANAVLRAQPEGSGYEKELISHRKGNLTPYVAPLMNTREQARFLVSRIEGLYDEGYALNDIAILYRAHYQALDTQLEFTRRGIPFIITSGLKFFEQAHIKDFVAQLRLMSNPADTSAMDRLFGLLPRVGPATVRKIHKSALKELESLSAEHHEPDDLFNGPRQGSRPSLFDALNSDSVISKVPADAREDFKQLAATLREVYPEVSGQNSKNPVPPSEIVEHTLNGWYSEYIRNVYSDWENRQDDLNGLVSFATRFDTMTELLAQLVLLNSETSEKSIELDDNSVRMTTIHQAKGLEFPVVFVIGCCEDLLPLKRAVEAGDIDEERRLFYVAVTRAKDELYITYPMIQDSRGGAMRMYHSRFLDEVPPNCYEKLNFTQRW